MVLVVAYAERGSPQMVGELGEMDRLEQHAEDAIANGDPEGAALSIGKAALMAKILAQKEEHQQTRSLYQAAETLFRGQEQGYRAFALFERAGGQPPASRGVCQYISDADEKVKQSRKDLRALPEFTNESLRDRRHRHIEKTQEWERLLQGLEQDLSC
ncbi:hypothetical protein [Candidatus Nitrospira neomarina]|uniref:Uncharacterized protein n=1 Tax=Candidatus Nitrospira neomarina TaxID=3020899 RepID=A0AA96GMN9_9BACT|nr:hypothetical protein [Candidatus Nitrospira neomarina]WNM63250.1 hypothetical protein PQG83_05720 [Candidatus Nitrospira neomarina]